MATLSDLRGYIRDWLGTSSTRLSDSTLLQIVNLAVKDVARATDAWPAETSATKAIVAGTNSYSIVGLSANVADRITSCYYANLVDGGSMVVLNEISFAEFNDKYGETNTMSTGSPVEYAVYGDGLYLGPTPDANFNLRVTLYTAWPALSSGSDHNAITDYAMEAVLFKSLVYATQYMLEDERVPMFERMYQDQLGKLAYVSRASKYAGRGFVQLQEPA